MKDLFVPYTQALELKELGFNEPCLKVGNTNGHIMWKCIEVDADDEAIDVNDILNVDYGEQWTSIPMFSQCFKWFQEKYKLYPEIGLHDREDEETWRFTISILGYYELAYNQDISKETYYKTYEEAELACLEKLIELTKNK